MQRFAIDRFRASTDRAAVPAAIALLVTTGYCSVRLVVAAHGQISRFVLAQRQFANPAQVPRGLAILPQNGYDGQFFYRLALNPSNLHKTAYGITFDSDFRVQRIGYPVLAWLVSFGHHPWVPSALVIVNVLAVAGIAYVGALFAGDSNHHALWGLLLAGYFGFVFSVGRDTAEPVAAVFMLAGLLAYRRRHPVLAGLALAYGALSRETVMVVVGAIAVVRIVGIARRRVRPGRDDVAWIVPSLVFVGWQVVTYAVTGKIALLADTQDNSGPLFYAPIHALIHNVSHLSIHAAAIDAWVVEFIVLVVFIVLAAVAMRSTTAPIEERVAFVFFIVELFVLSPGIWNGIVDLRSLNEVYLLAVLVLLGSTRSSRRLVVAGVSLAPALLIVFVHRTTHL